MQETELRMWNWVSSNGYMFQLQPKFFAESILEETLTKLEPVILDSEILVKSGFNQSVLDRHILYNKLEFKLIETIVHPQFFGNFSVYWKSEEPLCTINYLHELQNLYFDLTKTNLEVGLFDPFIDC